MSTNPTRQLHHGHAFLTMELTCDEWRMVMNAVKLHANSQSLTSNMKPLHDAHAKLVRQFNEGKSEVRL